MKVKNIQSPCLTCTKVTDPKNCENKQCRLWSKWFMERWEQIHGYYEACVPKEEQV